MAEYIDRAELFNQGEWMYDTKAECEADALRYVVKMNNINMMPIVDAIEREKIDKAIEEINNAEREVDFMNEYSSAFNSGLFKALEILKKNIGE